MLPLIAGLIIYGVSSSDEAPSAPEAGTPTAAETTPAGSNSVLPDPAKPLIANPAVIVLPDGKHIEVAPTAPPISLEDTLAGFLADCAVSEPTKVAFTDYAKGKPSLINTYIQAHAIPLLFTQENVTWQGYTGGSTLKFKGMPVAGVFSYKAENQDRIKFGLTLTADYRTVLRTVLPELPPGALKSLQIKEFGEATEVACLI